MEETDTKKLTINPFGPLDIAKAKIGKSTEKNN